MAEVKVGQKYVLLHGGYAGHVAEITSVTEDYVYYRPGLYYPDEDWEKTSFLANWEPVEDVPEESSQPVEVRSVSSTGAEKGVKASRFSLLPMEALTEVANHYGVGATKYEDHNMRRGYEWSKSYDALMRHATQFWSGEDRDEETGSKHLAAVVFHALTLMEFMETHPEFDDRYKLTI